MSIFKRPFGTKAGKRITYDDSQEMADAMRKARETVPQFTAALQQPKAAQSSFSVKIPVRDGEHEEHMWISPVRNEDGRFHGTIDNDPDRVTTVKAGTQITVAENELSDWMFIDNGWLVGGFTTRVLRSKMSEEEAEEFDQGVPFVIDDKRSPDDPLAQLFDSIGNADHELLSSLLTANPGSVNTVGKVAVPSPLGDMEIDPQHPLKYAVCVRNDHAAELLLQRGADPDARDEQYATPLHDAAQLDRPDTIRLLGKFGADVNARNVIGLSPLKAAAGNDNHESARALLDLGADVRIGLTKEESEDGVLHNIHSADMAKLLLDAGADIDATNDEGETPLHHALFNEFVDLAVFLIERGAAIHGKNAEGDTPMDAARDTLEGAEFARVQAAVDTRSGR